MSLWASFIPLSVIATGEQVVRDMFYDGHPRPEPGAIVCRVAPSFTRFGNFEIHAACAEIDILRALMDYTIHTDFPQLGPPSTDTYVRIPGSSLIVPTV